MCINCVIYSALSALAALLLLDGASAQLKGQALGLDYMTLVLAAEYFAAFALFAVAKYYKCRICCMDGNKSKASKPKRRR